MNSARKNFTKEQIEEMKRQYESGLSYRKIGINFNASHHAIKHNIETGFIDKLFIPQEDLDTLTLKQLEDKYGICRTTITRNYNYIPKRADVTGEKNAMYDPKKHIIFTEEDSKLLISEVAIKYGVNISIIRKDAKKQGFKFREYDNAHSVRHFDIDQEKIKYLNIQQIAELYNADSHTIKKHLKGFEYLRWSMGFDKRNKEELEKDFKELYFVTAVAKKHKTISRQIEYVCKVLGITIPSGEERFNKRIETKNGHSKAEKEICNFIKDELGIYNEPKTFKIPDSIKETRLYKIEDNKRRKKKESEGKTYRGLNVISGDCYIPSLNIVIEYDGNWYHGEKLDGCVPAKLKNMIYEYYGLRAIHIYEFEYSRVGDKQKVKDWLRSQLGQSEKIYARNTEMFTPTRREAKMFYDKYHLQGAGAIGAIRYGLKYNGEIVACMDFKKLKGGYYDFGKSDGYELRRLCFKAGVRVIGGTKKLFKPMCNETIVSYQNCDKFTGNVYRDLGFKLTGHSDDYVWCKNNTAYTRYHTTKSKVNKLLGTNYDISSMSEGEMMENSGYWRIWLSGTNTFVYTKKDEF